jgi:catechol 2,3-dioxygenase-like lactoylglutathione lyase family enzyme
MKRKYKALFLSPMIPSTNLSETVNFFKDTLDFSTVMENEGYAVCQKDKLTLHILRAGEAIGEMELYLEVDHVDNLWSAIKDKLTGLKFKEPFDQDYGMREIHICIPHTNALLFIGQKLS